MGTQRDLPKYEFGSFERNRVLFARFSARNTMFPVRSWPNRKGDAPYAGILGQYCLRSWFALRAVVVQEILAVRPMVLLDGKVKSEAWEKCVADPFLCDPGKRERNSASSSDLRC